MKSVGAELTYCSARARERDGEKRRTSSPFFMCFIFITRKRKERRMCVCVCVWNERILSALRPNVQERSRSRAREWKQM